MTQAKKAPAKKPAPRKRAPAKTSPVPPGPPEKGTGSAPASTRAPGKTSPDGKTSPAPADSSPGYFRRSVTSAAERVAKPQPGKSYHRIVLAEFVVCAVLILGGSILTPKVKDGAFVFVHVLVQLTAVCGVFFVLALLGAGKSTGKVAAAFGALVTLGVLLNNTGAVQEVGKIFSPPTKKAAAPTALPPGANKPPVQ